MRLGIFGGSFDPVHLGHLLLAESCREACELDKLWFVPAARSPHKQNIEPASDAARLEMLKLAIGGHDALDVSSVEIDRGGISYTVDTLTEIHEREEDADLCFLMGADSLADFPTWREPKKICQLAKLCIVSRPNSPRIDLAVLSPWLNQQSSEKTQPTIVAMPQLDISSSDIRQRVSTGRSIRYRTTRAVEKYIETQGIYRRKSLNRPSQ